jgi:hypothetical protein
MAQITSFNPIKTDLEDMLDDIEKANMQLPDLQRSWIWNDARIISLLESVSRGFPIGAILTLKSDGPRFLCRPIEGVKAKNDKPETILLDGQQRLTSLYRTLFSLDVVETKDDKGKKILRYYYADLEKIYKQAETGNFDDCFLSVNENHKKMGQLREVVLDLSSRELEWQQAMLPLNIIFDLTAFDDWKDGFCDTRPDGKELINKARDTALKNIRKYFIPVIELGADTGNEAVCTIFEKVNMGGVPLTVFELLVATYAGGGFRLVNDWEVQRTKITADSQQLLKDIDRVSYLTAVLVTSQLRAGQRVTCKRGDLLSMNKDDYLATRESVTIGFIRAAKLLYREGIFLARDIAYQTQIPALAAVYSVLSEQDANLDPINMKLARWLWCGIFGEQWASGVDSRTARDVLHILAWLRGGDEPESVKEALLTEDRLLHLSSRRSAAYKGISALIYRSGALDFRSGFPISTQMIFDNNIDIHHIFPKAACDKLKIGSDDLRRECIINKTPIDAFTNRSIGGYLPSQYLQNLETNPRHLIPHDRLDQILQSHNIDVKAVRGDNFDDFFNKRKEYFISLIESLMGKKVVRGDTGDKEEVDNDTVDEELN